MVLLGQRGFRVACCWLLETMQLGTKRNGTTTWGPGRVLIGDLRGATMRCEFRAAV